MRSSKAPSGSWVARALFGVMALAAIALLAFCVWPARARMLEATERAEVLAERSERLAATGVGPRYRETYELAKAGARKWSAEVEDELYSREDRLRQWHEETPRNPETNGPALSAEHLNFLLRLEDDLRRDVDSALAKAGAPAGPQPATNADAVLRPRWLSEKRVPDEASQFRYAQVLINIQSALFVAAAQQGAKAYAPPEVSPLQAAPDGFEWRKRHVRLRLVVPSARIGALLAQLEAGWPQGPLVSVGPLELQPASDAAGQALPGWSRLDVSLVLTSAERAGSPSTGEEQVR